MKKLILSTLLLLAVILSGCMYQKVDNVEIEKAAELCGNVSAIVSIKSLVIGGVLIYCKNGNAYTYNDDKVK